MDGIGDTGMTRPERCLLCRAAGSLASAGFSQRYLQAGRPAMLVPWWLCMQCRGWFAYPTPSMDMIQSNWGVVEYADLSKQRTVAAEKEALFDRILHELRAAGLLGNLLDVGCNTGMFMLAARNAGWKVAGFDPNESAIQVARQQGLDVKCRWLVHECGYTAGYFQTITAIDVFYYSWNPFEDLKAYYNLLDAGGILAMRISNKRFAAGVVRWMTRPGPHRDYRLSRILQGQFHSVCLRSLVRILKKVGFDDIRCLAGAMTSRRQAASWKSWLAYSAADVIRYATGGGVNLSPGILLLARKPRSDDRHARCGSS
jgi:SAM-dependent methyltransferase